VIFVLLKHFRTNQIVVASRSSARTQDVIENFKGSSQGKLSAFNPNDSQFNHLLETSDVVINATPAGMFPKTDETPVPDPHFRRGQIVVDLIYRPLGTEFLQRASSAGAQTISGLEMFILQGARAFEIWTDRTMDTQRARDIVVRKLEQESATP